MGDYGVFGVHDFLVENALALRGDAGSGETFGELRGGYCPLGEGVAEGGGAGCGELVQVEQDGQGVFAVGEVGAECFAGACFVAGEVGDVVEDLVGGSEVASVSGTGVGVVGVVCGEVCAEAAGEFKEFCCLEADDAVILFECEAGVTALGILVNFAGADLACCSGDVVADVGGWVAGGEREGVGEERIAEQDGGVRAVAGGGGGGVVAQTGAVEDVVVDECGEMDEFDDGGCAHECRVRRGTVHPAGVKYECGTEAFAVVGEGIGDEIAHGGLEFAYLREEKGVELPDVCVERREECVARMGAGGLMRVRRGVVGGCVRHGARHGRDGVWEGKRECFLGGRRGYAAVRFSAKYAWSSARHSGSRMPAVT